MALYLETPLEEVDVGNAANVIAKWKDSYLKNDKFLTPDVDGCGS